MKKPLDGGKPETIESGHSRQPDKGDQEMQARQVAVKPWHKTCSRCKKPVFQDLLDEQGLCEYCRAIVAMKTTSRKKRGQKPSH